MMRLICTCTCILRCDLHSSNYGMLVVPVLQLNTGFNSVHVHAIYILINPEEPVLSTSLCNHFYCRLVQMYSWRSISATWRSFRTTLRVLPGPVMTAWLMPTSASPTMECGHWHLLWRKLGKSLRQADQTSPLTCSATSTRHRRLEKP